MRDRLRIARMLRKLEVLWWNHPDLRLGQLVQFVTPAGVSDSFYIEDDEWERRIDAAIQSLAIGSREGSRKP